MKNLILGHLMQVMIVLLVAIVVSNSLNKIFKGDVGNKLKYFSYKILISARKFIFLYHLHCIWHGI